MNVSPTLIESIIASLATVVILFLAGILVRYPLCTIFRWFIKPRISIIVNEETLDTSNVDKTSPFSNLLPLYGDFSLWLESSRSTVHINRITYRRLCIYQDNCLLFDFLSRMDLERSNKCSIAEVDYVKSNVTGLKPLSGEEKIEQIVHGTGKLSYQATINNLQKRTWVNIGSPFYLLKKIPHTIEVTIEVTVILEENQRISRMINFLLVRIFRLQNSTEFIVMRRLNVRFKKAMQTGETDTVKADSNKSMTFGFKYDGSPRIRESMESVLAMRKFVDDFVTKHPPSEVVEIPTLEMRDVIRKDLPLLQFEGYSQPPNGKYRTLPENAWRDLVPFYEMAKDFCGEFLNCSNYAQLNVYLTQFFVVVPFLFEYSYKYLVVVNRNPFEDIKMNFRTHTANVFLILFNIFKVEAQCVKAKRHLRRLNKNLAINLRKARYMSAKT